MGVVVKAAFSAGELDPALWERTTLDKYKAGLATGRNWIVTKTGGVATRPGRFLFKTCKFTDSQAVCISPPGSNIVVEWGNLYARGYNYVTGTLLWDSAHFFLASDIPNLHFETSGSYLYVFCQGKTVAKVLYTTGVFVGLFSLFATQPAPPSCTVTSEGTPTGYTVEYAITYINNGEESIALTAQHEGGGGTLLPIAAGQSVVIDPVLIAGSAVNTNITQVNFYRRPQGAGAYGYIGSSSNIFGSGSNLISSFVDLGQDADYTHSPPASIMRLSGALPIDPSSLQSKTGVIYQQRLLINDGLIDLEAIYASRPAYQTNFLQDFPLNSASALKFKAGTSGYAKVLRMLDSDGLVVFTSAGIFLNQGTLDETNIALAKKGGWIINAAVPALAVPGGVLFVDSATNSVRNLIFDLYSNKFQAPEVSIYSNHLFRSRAITYWNFQEGAFPLLYVIFSDGTYATFTFEFDQQMQAWTRHDSAQAILVESSCGTDATTPDTTFFVVSKTVNGVTTRYIEQSIPRYIPAAQVVANPEADKGVWCAYMDSVVTTQTLLNNQLLGTDQFQLSPTSNDQDWSGGEPLNMTCGTSGIFGHINSALEQVGGTIIGQVFRYFDSDGAAFNFTVLTLVNGNAVTVSVDNPFDPANAVGFRLYETLSQVNNLTHLEGEDISIIVDGAVVASPNNDDQNYPTVTVTNGVALLPNGITGAIVHVGRPIIGDLQTLDIDTVEQAPTLIESLNVNKLYIKVHNSAGLYVGNSFPVDTIVAGMQSLDSYDLDYSQDNPIIVNRYQAPQTKRIELTLPGDWKSQGKICIRQVDPLHAEILSIIPDVEVLTRSDR